MPPTVPTFGVEIIEGKPGSGKSYMAVVRVLRVIELQRRVVYTNLPLRWRVVRKYLRTKGGDVLANLIRPLTQEHFDRFIKRFVAKSKLRDRIKMRAKLRGRTVSSGHIERVTHRCFGPDLVAGEDANWIPPGSVLVLDEVQWWYPMSRQKEEPPELLEYLSMHRHCWHWVWVITQEAGRISISFRKMCTAYLRVRNMAQERMLWGIRWGHVGIRPFAYWEFTGDQVENRAVENTRPVSTFAVFPNLPWNKVFFRLYDSFSHIGSAARLRAAIKAQRLAAGLDEHGKVIPSGDGDTHTTEDGNETMATTPKASGVLAVIGKVLRSGFFLAAAVIVGFAVGRASHPPGAGPAESPPLVPAAAASPTPSPASAASPDVPPPRIWGRWSGSGEGFALVDGKRVSVGQVGPGGARLMDVDPQGGGSVWATPDDLLWLWEFGADAPRPVGKASVVLAYIRGQQAARGSGVPGAAGPAPETMGPRPGDSAR